MTTRLVPIAGIVVEEIDGDLCLLRLDSNDLVVLNRTASDVWLLVSDGMETTEIVSVLAASYGLETAMITDQVAGVIADLMARGFLVEQR